MGMNELGKPSGQRPAPSKPPMIGGRVVSGLAYLEAMARGEVPQAPFCDLLGARLTEVSEGRAVFRCQASARHYNTWGVVHGGLAAMLVDSATGLAVLSTLPIGHRATTVELKVNFTRPIAAETGWMDCVGTMIHRGRRIATAEARLLDPEGRLLAHGTATCLVFELGRPVE